jgi:hypothetical protein
VFKKALQIAVTLSLLIGGYTGYTRLFVVASFLLSEGRADELTAFPEIDAESAKKATALAREMLGADHWAAQNDLKLNYIEEQRGYNFYAQTHEFENDRKRLILKPFAVILNSADGKAHKTVTSDVAIIDMSGPFGTLKPGAEPSHIVHAKLIGNVRIRDDKGTSADRTDDLRIGPMTQLEYDEPTLQITSDSDIFLEDRDLWLTGLGMMIQLRRKLTFIDPNAPPVGGGGGSFDAETIYVYKDVHIVSRDVGQNGILPGPGKPEPTGKTPFDLRCDRTMRIDLPPPHPPVLIGPPDLNRKPEPTFAYFKVNVRVIRGTDKSDELNCDTLDVTLMPRPRPPEAEPTDELDESVEPAGSVVVAASATLLPAGSGSAAEAPAKGSGGPLSDLQLHKAIARGDAVWIRSEAQGLNARCVELIHQKRPDGSTDFTYLNGGVSTKLYVEKTDYDTKSPVPGTIKSILVLKAQDATIFDFGPGTSKVLARGPGRADERPARNAPIQRTAFWEDEMELLTWREGEVAMPMPHDSALRALSDVDWHGGPPTKGTLRRVITMTGVSKLIDHGTPTAVEAGQTTTLDARKTIVAEFQAGPKLDPKAPDGPSEIKWLDAYQDAHLTAPSKTLTARDYLKPRFWSPPPPPALTPSAPPAGGPGPALAASDTPAPPTPEAKPDPAPATPEPAVDGRADRIWANILMGSAGAKSELKNAMLRGGVMVHQDPAPGKIYPNEAAGEAIDLTGQGKGLMKFAVKAEEPPHAFDPKTKLASSSKGRRSAQFNLARVDFDGKTVESEDIIGLDQKKNLAWAEGAGVFSQLNDRGLLDDKGVDADNSKGKTKNGGPTPQDKMVITWNNQMLFYGNSKDLDGRPAAKIEFRGISKDVQTPSGKIEFRRGVVARLPESVIQCESMDVYMDRTIDLAKDTRKSAPKSSSEPSQPDAQIAMLDCWGKNFVAKGKPIPGVDIINEKKFPGTTILKEKQRIQGVWVVYDKRTGEFEAPGPGTTWLYQRDGKAADQPTPASLKTGKPVIPGMKLTKVKYIEGMQGRFGVARDQVDDQRREALFLGSAQAANASVLTGDGDINFDDKKKAKDWVFLTSDEIHVFTEPMASVGSQQATTKQLLFARLNSTARTVDSTIQADRITYDSSTELMYAYGEDDKEVSLTKQESDGQTPTTTRGKTLRYNKATRASDFQDPQFIQFVDLKSGFRPKPYYPDLGGTPDPFQPPKPPRLPFQRTQRSSTERKTFTNGQ